MNRVLFALTWASLLPLAASTAAAPAPATQTLTVQIPLRGLEFALSPTTGALAVIDPQTPAVRFFPTLSSRAQTNDSTEVKVGSTPIGLAWKQLGPSAYFLVLCSSDHTLYLIEDGKLQVARKILLKRDNPFFLAAASDPSVPYVYYIGGSSENSSEGPTCRINLATLADEGPVLLGPEHPIEPLDQITTSADGTMLYGRRGQVSPTGLFAFHIPGNARPPIQAVKVEYFHETSPPFYIDPHNQFVAAGNVVYDPELKPLQRLPAQPMCFLPTRPFFFALNKEGVHAFSSNTFKQVKSVPIAGWDDIDPIIASGMEGPNVPMPKVPAHTAIGRVRRYFLTCILADLKNDNLLLCKEDKLAIIPLKAFDLPDEPLMRVAIDGKRTLNVGQPGEITLAKRDPRIQIELKQVPQGMKLVGQQLLWQPSPTDVGEITITLRLTLGTVEHTQSLSLFVHRPGIALPFVPDMLAISRDGSGVVVLRKRANDVRDPSVSIRDDHNFPGCRIAVIDPQKSQVTASRDLTVNILAVAIDQASVYAALQDSDAILVFNRADLTDAKRVFTPKRVRAIIPISSKLLYTSSYQSPSVAYSLPDMAPLPDEAQGTNYRGDQTSEPVAIGDGWYYNGVLYNRDMSSPRLICQSFTIPMLPSLPQRIPSSPRDAHPPIAAWDVKCFGNSLQRLSGQVAGRIDNSQTIILPDLPAAVSLDRITDTNARPRPQVRHQLVFRDLVTASVVHTLSLTDDPIQEPSPNAQMPMRLLAVPGLVAALVNDRLFVLSPRSLPLDKLPLPLHFPLDQKIIQIDPAKPTTVLLNARGGKGPIEYRLAVEYPGLSVNPTTGLLTIEPAQFVDKAVQYLRDNAMSVAQNRTATNPRESVTQRYMNLVSPAFQKLTGRPPKGPLVLLPVSLTAQDAERQTTALYCAFLLEVPVESLAPLVAQEQQPLPAVRSTPSQLGDLRRKVADLEKRNLQLESQLGFLDLPVGYIIAGIAIFVATILAATIAVMRSRQQRNETLRLRAMVDELKKQIEPPK